MMQRVIGASQRVHFLHPCIDKSNLWAAEPYENNLNKQPKFCLLSEIK